MMHRRQQVWGWKGKVPRRISSFLRLSSSGPWHFSHLRLFSTFCGKFQQLLTFFPNLRKISQTCDIFTRFVEIFHILWQFSTFCWNFPRWLCNMWGNLSQNVENFNEMCKNITGLGNFAQVGGKMSKIVEIFHKTWKKVSSGKNVTDLMNEA